MYERIIKLIGIEKLNLIKSKSVMVIGLGGVGGYAVEGLIRSGIQNIIIVDYDKIDITNLNRQLITNTNNIGLNKTDVMEIHIKSINPNCNVTKINIKLNLDNIDILFKYKIDYLIDACDTIVVKQELIKRCINNKIKIISSMGKEKKFNQIKGYIPVVCSKEQNKKFEGSIPSLMFVPATSGLLCSNYVIKDIIKDK